jgi:hypothetical protein
MTARQPLNGGALAQRALTWVGGIIGALFVIFLGWLAATVIDIQGRVIRIETTAKALSDARDRDIQNTGARNAARIDQIESQQRRPRQ